MIHYNNCVTTEDKIIHLLYAAEFNDCYEQAINECIDTFGITITNEAICIFEADFRRH